MLNHAAQEGWAELDASVIATDLLGGEIDSRRVLVPARGVRIIRRHGFNQQ
ncbi:Beta-galactosidase C-terminal domain [Paenibacillus herberti]|uniref:Beta-galactosidase C-terminal domain n=1 Tax=Paenibacillus herberti TaxID=1619309 RepID=UPI003CCC44A6